MNILAVRGVAPRNHARCLRRSTSRLALLAGTVGLAAFSSPAQAQCVEGPPNNFTCSGQTDDPQILAGFDPVVVTTGDFDVDTSNNGNGPALTVTGVGEVSYTDLQASQLQGFGVAFVSIGDNGPNEGGITAFSDGNIIADGTNALRLENAGTGDINVVWEGAITNSGGNGVVAIGEVGSSGITLNLAGVTASGNAIDIQNDGSGITSVTATGTVASVTNRAVDIDVTGGAQDVTVNLATVIGGTSGIDIQNGGSGATNLTISGAVSLVGGGNGNGINVFNDDNTTGLTVNANTVQGNSDAFVVTSDGSGDTIVSASGLVVSNNASGIFATNSIDSTAGDLIITTADVRAATNGIVAQQGGTGDTIVTANGLVIGETEVGVFVYTLDADGLTTQNMSVTTGQVRGGTDGISVANAGLGETLINATGAVSGAQGDGITVRNQNFATNLTLFATDTRGATDGIAVENEGTGFTRVVSSGTAVGLESSGITIFGGPQSTAISLDAASVTGGFSGIFVANLGTGPTSISASGPVSGGGSAGISAFNDTNATDLTINTARVSGGTNGIAVDNSGTGVTRLTSTGLVSGTTGIGIQLAAEGTDILVDVIDVQGAATGIEVDHAGTGFTRVSATGTVNGLDGDGIDVATSDTTQGVRVEAATVNASDIGIQVSHQGSGSVSLTASGPVSGSDGITVATGALGTDIRIDATSVDASSRGVRAVNGGTGQTIINASGPVTGTGFAGISALNGPSSTDVSISVVDVLGANAGIAISNTGSGTTQIFSGGSIVATDGNGIEAVAGVGADSISMSVTNVRGTNSGILAFNGGLGSTVVLVNGLVEGNDDAVNIEVNGTQLSVISNAGTIRNISGQSFDRAITVTGGSAAIGNGGTLIGTLSVSGNDSFMFNEGSWNSIGGINLFAGADDEVLNFANGVIVAGSGATNADTTTWFGLERYVTQGLTNMIDGGVGDVVQTSADTQFSGDGSILAVDIGGVNGADLYRTTGSVDIETGSLLDVSVAQPLTLGGQYVIVNADGGLTGEFSFENEFVTAFAGLRDGYTATTAFLEFAQLRDLADAGLTPNQIATAGGADSLPGANPVKNALVLLPDDAAAQDAFDQLSGEIHPSVHSALAEDSRLPRNAVLDRLSEGGPGRLLWGRALANRGDSDGDFNAAPVDRDSWGFIAGADVALGQAVTLGIAAGYLDTDLDVPERNSTGSARTIHLLGYAGARFGRFGVRAGVGYAWADIDTRRAIAFPGFTDTVEAAYDGSILQGFIEAGYRIPVSDGHVEPFASVAVIRARIDGFTETGGPAALTAANATETSTISTLGVRFETARAGAFSVGGRIGWQHGFGGLDPVTRLAFAGGDDFDIIGAAQSRDAGIANVEARFRLSPGVTFSLAYDGVLGTAAQDHAITGGFRIAF